METLHYLVDFILHINVHLDELMRNYGNWVYAILFLIIFCETGLVITPFLPGDSLLFSAGALAASSDEFSIYLLALLFVVGAFIGDTVNFEIGKYFGHKLFSNPNSKIFKQSYLQKTHEFYEKHGGKTIILARFVPIVRTFAPFVAGMGRMSYKYFISYNIIGGVVWVFIFLFLGYFVGNIGWVKNNLPLLMILIIVVSILPAILEILRNKFIVKKDK